MRMLGRSVVSLASIALAVIGPGALAKSPPPIAEAAPTSPSQILGPGVVHLYHVLPGADESALAAFEARLRGRQGKVAGVRHEVVADLSRVREGEASTSGLPGSVSAPTTLVVSHDGRVLATAPIDITAADPLGVVESQIVRATKDRSIDEYNLPKPGSPAIEGYDPVAYFIDGRARPGDKRLEAEFRGVKYRFATAEHRDRFMADPLRFVPTYGGWCASAMGDGGRKVEIDPKNFKVKDDRLFLFYKSVFADAKKDWDKNEKAWEPAADDHWRRLAGEEPIKPAELDRAQGAGHGTGEKP